MAGTLLLDNVKKRLAPLDADGLLATAIRGAGHEDFGDPPCEEPLRIIVDACNAEANLNLFGQVAARQHLLGLLETRLRLMSYWRETPGIHEQTLRRPLFITGLPRSGTTFLHDLLAKDPDNRAPRTWEVMFPIPPPTRDGFDSDPRIAKTESRLRWLRWIQPAIVKAHPIGATLPQECIAITSYSLRSDEFLEMFRIPSYETWLRTQDMRPVYRFHKNFLNHLQWRCSGQRWVLKAPDHVYSLAALVEVYPDARIVFLHRDPLKVLGSVASLTTMLRGAFSRHIDRDDTGADEARILAEKTHQMMAFRENNAYPEEHLMDVRYLDLVRDPIGTVREIYNRFGLVFSADAEARMNDLLKAPHNKGRSRHVYSLTDFGLDPRHEDPRFADYRERFDVEREAL